MIVSIDKLHREAQQAAQRYQSANEACPYPFGTEAANVFCAFFYAIKKADALVPAIEAELIAEGVLA
jgi:hypothetical protein